MELTETLARPSNSPSPPPLEPRSRRNAIPVIGATTSEIVEITNNVRKRSRWDIIKVYMPMAAWCLWLFIGTLWYRIHCHFDWDKSYYVSVDIGLSVSWAVLPDAHEDFYSVNSKLFSLLHLTIGVIFAGVFIMYIEQEMIKEKGDWMIQAVHRSILTEDTSESSMGRRIHAYLSLHFPRFKLVLVCILVLIFGITWFSQTIIGWDAFYALDFVVAAVTGSGYRSLPLQTPPWQYVITATFAGAGGPFVSITIGLMISALIHRTSDKEMYARIVEDITPEEIEFMKEFGIDDGDGTIDRNEFIILTVVRIGAIPADLITQINERFKELDRRHVGYLRYDDVVFGRSPRPSLMTAAETAAWNAMASMTSVMQWRSQSSLPISPDPEGPDETNISENITPSAVNPDSNIPGRLMSSLSKVWVSPEDNRQTQLKVPHRVSGIPQKQPRSTIVAFLSRRNLSQLSPATKESETQRVLTPPKESFIQTSRVVPFEDVKEENGVTPFSSDVAEPFRAPALSSVRSEASSVEGEKASINQVPYSSTNAGKRGSRAGPVRISSLLNTYTEDDDDDLESEEGDHFNKNPEDTIRPAAVATSRKSFLSSNNIIEGGSDNATHADSPIPEDKPAPLAITTPGGDLSLRRLTLNVQHARESSNILLAVRDQKRALETWYKNAACASVLWYLMDPYVQAVLAWLIWLFGGTVFYRFYMNNMNWARAFHLSGSIGYSMWWSQRAKFDTTSKILSVFYMFLGKFALGAAMAVFAKSLAASKSWYIEALRKKALDNAANTDSVIDDIVSFFVYHLGTIKILSVFFLYVVFGTTWSCLTYGWPLIDGLYFACSALAGGGRRAIPDESPDRDYVIVGIFIATGIPIMSVAMGMIAHYIVFQSESTDKIQEKMLAGITETELELMKIFGIEDGSGDIDQNEFVILTLVRIGALQPELIHQVTGLYDTLTSESGGVLTYDSLQRMSSSPGRSPQTDSFRKLNLRSSKMKRSSFIEKKSSSRSVASVASAKAASEANNRALENV